MPKVKTQKETVQSLKAELKKTLNDFYACRVENNQLKEQLVIQKNSFQMVKNNFEREKTRLDQALTALVQTSKK
jgi:hypothetical protein